MARIGRLNVEVGATNKTKGGLLLASKDISRWAKQTRKATMDVGSMALKSFATSGAAAAASLGAAGAAMGYFVAKTIDAVGDANDFAKSVGSSYTELRTLQKAAGLSGVSIETTNVALMKMSDVLGSAFGGNKAAIDSFKNIGVSVDSLRRMRPEQQFVAIAEAINKIDDPAKKVAAARDIFGKSGGGLISFFKNAKGDIADAAKAMDLYGISLKQIDVEKIDAAGDAMGEFKFILEGVGNQLAKNFAPLITATSEDLVDMIKTLGGVGPAVDMAFDGAIDKLTGMANTVDRLSASYEKFAGRINAGVGWVADKAAKAAEATGISAAWQADMTERRITKGIAPKHQDEARKLIKERGGFEREGISARRISNEMNIESRKHMSKANDSDKRIASGNGFGDWFKAWEQNAQMKGAADAAAALGDASEKRLDAEEKITKELKAQKGIQEAGQGALALMALGGRPVGMSAKGKGAARSAATSPMAKAASSEGEEPYMPALESKTFPGRAPGVFTTAAGQAASSSGGGAGFGTKEYFDQVLGLGGAGEKAGTATDRVNEKYGLGRFKRGGPNAYLHRIPDPNADPNYESKVPTGEPNWKSKIPTGAPKWESRTVMGSAIGRGDGGGADMSETNGLLREVRDALRGGVKGVYA